jgi:C1A family cysteine protease
VSAIPALVEPHRDEAISPNGTGAAPPELRPASGFGWLPDPPDIRDYTVAHPKVAEVVRKLRVPELRAPSSVDLRPYFSPIEDQQNVGSCTAQAGVGIVEYYQRRAFNKHLDGSRLFLYKATRNLLGWQGDTGAYLRTTMGALCMFGVAPEKYWPYAVARYDAEPPAFVYVLGQAYQAETFHRLDTAGLAPADLLTSIKQHLAAGLPPMFGFTVYESYRQAQRDGRIPFPSATERVVGGHAVVAVGYDDAAVVKHAVTGATTTGAFLIRNSWGSGWGQAGYGLLPYEYVRRRLAVDWWVLTKAEWLDPQAFQA